MPLEFVHPGIENTAVRIETPQNPSSEQNLLISRKLILGTPLGKNPQQSTSTGGENIKKIPGKVLLKLLKLVSVVIVGVVVVPSGDGGPSGCSRGPAPTGAPPPVPGVVTRAAAGGGGVWCGVLLLYLFEMPSTYTEALL